MHFTAPILAATAILSCVSSVAALPTGAESTLAKRQGKDSTSNTKTGPSKPKVEEGPNGPEKVINPAPSFTGIADQYNCLGGQYLDSFNGQQRWAEAVTVTKRNIMDQLDHIHAGNLQANIFIDKDITFNKELKYPHIFANTESTIKDEERGKCSSHTLGRWQEFPVKDTTKLGHLSSHRIVYERLQSPLGVTYTLCGVITHWAVSEKGMFQRCIPYSTGAKSSNGKFVEKVPEVKKVSEVKQTGFQTDKDDTFVTLSQLANQPKNQPKKGN